LSLWSKIERFERIFLYLIVETINKGVLGDLNMDWIKEISARTNKKDGCLESVEI
jgi:predicted aspartyl protease